MRIVLLLVVFLAITGCKKAHGPGETKPGRSPATQEQVIDRQVSDWEAKNLEAATEGGLPEVATGFAFGSLYRVEDGQTGTVCYVTNSHPPAISCVIPTAQQ